MFNSIRTSIANKEVVTDLTRKMNLGAENIIARIAFAFSISTNIKFKASEMKDSKGKEYRTSVLFGNNLPFYIAMVCVHYGIYKTDKDVARYIKMHIDHGLDLINKEMKRQPNLTGFEFLADKIEIGLKYLR